MALRIIDADTHVIESQETFSYMLESEKKLSPMILSQTWGPQLHAHDGNVRREFWAIDGRLQARHRNVNNAETTADQRECKDISGRLKQMDGMGVDVQILYPTLFNSALTQKPDLYFALARSYNRWLADVWHKSGGRLRYVAIPPILSMDKVRDEFSFCKDNGASGIFMVGLECDLEIDDPYFFPLWKAASDLDLAVCFHSGNHSLSFGDIYSRNRFMTFRSTGIGAFHTLVMNNIPAKFPLVRWAFIEFSASWIPYVFNNLELNYRKKGDFETRADDAWSAKDLLKTNRMYTTCQITDDLPYILGIAGEDNLVIGTDYGHNDAATEIEAMGKLRKEDRVGTRAVDKILDANARALYGLN